MIKFQELGDQILRNKQNRFPCSKLKLFHCFDRRFLVLEERLHAMNLLEGGGSIVCVCGGGGGVL